jgi:uncharacterized membrane protein YeaQ/YmgE (transglycosylase-associated protein family)
MLGLIGTIIFGAIVGWIASMIMKTDEQQGALANIGVGLVGAAIGNLLFGLIGLESSNLLGRFLIALAGAVVLLFIFKAVTSKGK